LWLAGHINAFRWEMASSCLSHGCRFRYFPDQGATKVVSKDVEFSHFPSVIYRQLTTDYYKKRPNWVEHERPYQTVRNKKERDCAE
jgi:hypothetical protein